MIKFKQQKHDYKTSSDINGCLLKYNAFLSDLETVIVMLSLKLIKDTMFPLLILLERDENDYNKTDLKGAVIITENIAVSLQQTYF